MPSNPDEAFKRAVSVGLERRPAGVALAATGSGITANAQCRDADFLVGYGTLLFDPTSAPVSTKPVTWLDLCTKLVTSIAADVERLLPEWHDPPILAGFEDGRPMLTNAKEKITLRHWRTRVAWLTTSFHHRCCNGGSRGGKGSLAMSRPITECSSHPLVFEPGTGLAYGSGLDVARLMVAQANNCTLEEYMRKHILDVLGMSGTSFRSRTVSDLEKRLMAMACRMSHVACRPSPDEPLMSGDAPNTRLITVSLHPIDEYGGASLFGSAEDYLKPLKSILRNDGQLLNRRASI